MSVKSINFWKGQLIELQNKDREIYQTQIISLDDEMIYVQTPINRKQELMNVQSGQPVTVYFQSDEDEYCSFEDQLRFRYERLAIRIPHRNEVQSAQRRHYFRVPATLDITVFIEEETDNEHTETDVEKIVSNTLPPLKTRDVSGGGLSFICPIKLEPEQFISGKVHLLTHNIDKTVDFEAQVIISRKSGANFVVACEFINMKEIKRQDFIQFCLNRQIELKRKLG